LTLPENKPRFHLLPASLRILTTPGISGHAVIFTFIMALLFATVYVGRAIRFSEAWPIVFAIGASTGGTYLVLSLLTLWERTKKIIFYSRLKTRIIVLGLVFGPLLTGLSYWIYQAGSVEALPFFPAFIVIFYGWVLLQAYFIATPVSHLLTKVEKGMDQNGGRKNLTKTLGAISLLIPVAPLVYGVWMISSWLSSSYQNVQGANEKIIAWTISVLVILLLTFTVVLQWGWKTLRGGRPQASIFAGGTFLALWGYLLYRATTLVIGYISQNQPPNPVADTLLIAISIVGAMQSFAGKTINRTDKRLNQILPFLVFAFGSIYAVAQFYFILQVAITRVELSIAVNATVFVTGLLVMMLLIRRHLIAAGIPSTALSVQKKAIETTSSVSQGRLSFFNFLRQKKRTSREHVDQLAQDESSSTEQITTRHRPNPVRTVPQYLGWSKPSDTV